MTMAAQQVQHGQQDEELSSPESSGVGASLPHTSEDANELQLQEQQVEGKVEFTASAPPPLPPSNMQEVSEQGLQGSEAGLMALVMGEPNSGGESQDSPIDVPELQQQREQQREKEGLSFRITQAGFSAFCGR